MGKGNIWVKRLRTQGENERGKGRRYREGKFKLSRKMGEGKRTTKTSIKRGTPQNSGGLAEIDWKGGLKKIRGNTATQPGNMKRWISVQARLRKMLAKKEKQTRKNVKDWRRNSRGGWKPSIYMDHKGPKRKGDIKGKRKRKCEENPFWGGGGTGGWFGK